MENTILIKKNIKINNPNCRIHWLSRVRDKNIFYTSTYILDLYVLGDTSVSQNVN